MTCDWYSVEDSMLIVSKNSSPGRGIPCQRVRKRVMQICYCWLCIVRDNSVRVFITCCSLYKLKCTIALLACIVIDRPPPLINTLFLLPPPSFTGEYFEAQFWTSSHSVCLPQELLSGERKRGGENGSPLPNVLYVCVWTCDFLVSLQVTKDFVHCSLQGAVEQVLKNLHIGGFP